MTHDDFRDIALSLQGAIERAHMGHPDFRANGRIFATLHADEQWGTLKLTPEEQREFMRIDPDVFVPASGAWGRQGWTNVRLDAADEATVRGAMIMAWENVAAKRPSRRSSRSARSQDVRLSRKRRR
jgi:predicted DNA-binding protein (MmcQ/YjbR family)